MIKNKVLARAVTLVFTGTALSIGTAGDAAAHTMYNTFNAYSAPAATDGGSGTDGWTRVDGPGANYSLGAALGSGGNAVKEWVGTSGAVPSQVRPFGYQGHQALNWAAEIHGAGDSLEISQLDATNRYGSSWGYADIDTARGAWNDKGPLGNATSGQGWAHNTDYGLFKSHVDVFVTLTPSTLAGNWNNFGITVFTGMDSATSSYSHHAGWNAKFLSGGDPDNSNPSENPAKLNNPHGTSGLTYLTHSELGDLTFLALADQIYSIYLGGNSGSGNFGPHDGYKLAITTTAVPVPAAAWLFGGALAGLVGSHRRRRVVPA
jgi:hypothetical protein